MDVRSVAGLIDERLGRERGPEAVAVSDGPHGLPIEDLAIGGFERRRVADRELLLAVAELRVVLLDRNPLRPRARPRGRPSRARPSSSRRWRSRGYWSSGANPPSGCFTARVNSHSKAARTLNPAAAQAAICRLRKERGHASHGAPSSVRMSLVMAAACGAYGRTVKVSRIRDEPDLADGAQALDGLELVQHVHRLHGHVRPMPSVSRCARPSTWVALPRVTPPLSV